MALQIKTLQEIQQLLISSLLMSVNTGQTDIKKQIDPSIRNSLIGGLVSSLSAGFDDNNQLLKQILKELFPPVLLRICIFISSLKKSQP